MKSPSKSYHKKHTLFHHEGTVTALIPSHWSLHSPAVNRLGIAFQEPIDHPSWTLSISFYTGGRLTNLEKWEGFQWLNVMLDESQKKQKYPTSNSIAQIFQSVTAEKCLGNPSITSTNTDSSSCVRKLRSLCSSTFSALPLSPEKQ